MVKLSNIFKKALKIQLDKDAYLSEENCWWILDEQIICEILQEEFDKTKNIYEYRRSLFDSDILGDKIGIPENDISIDDISILKINNYYTIYLDNPPKLI